MTAYVYVVGIWNHKREEMRFEHKVVLADFSDHAYNVGYAAAKDAGIFPLGPNESANDYVIQLLED